MGPSNVHITMVHRVVEGGQWVPWCWGRLLLRVGRSVRWRRLGPWHHTVGRGPASTANRSEGPPPATAFVTADVQSSPCCLSFVVQPVGLDVLHANPPASPPPPHPALMATVSVQVTWPRSASTRKVTRISDGEVRVPFSVV